MMEFRHSAIISLLTLVLLLPVRSQDDNFYRVTYNITEEQEEGIFVGNTALDTGLFNTDSSQDFQDLKFELFGNGNDKARYFSIDEQTGVVRTRERIDREEVCGNRVDCTMILDMAVYRKTSPDSDYNFYKSIQVVIRVEDKNDNAPEFPQKVVTMTMPENMPAPYRLSTSVATDPDMIGPNSDITYSFQTDEDVFELEVKENSDTGLTELAIKVTEMLDREAEDSYYVTIVASDNGSPRQSGSVLINIAITDRNDNAPIFTSSNYSVNVYENASVLDPILTVSAIDKDINNNGQVLYQLGPRVGEDIKNHFHITENDGKVYLTRPVDYEAVTKFVFVVEALDRGEPQQSSAAYIVVNIIDVNDNAPEIILNLSPSGTDILEHQSANKFLGHITVSDRDSGALGNVVCEIDDPNFRLDPFDGQPDIYKIVLDQPLDHEDQAVRRVTIRCRDSDKNPLMATKTFTVKVLDINDNAPQFTRSTFTGVVLENQPPQTNVLTSITDATGNVNLLRIVAEDLDSGDFGRVNYSIAANTNFSIDPLMGTLNTLVTFDREVQAQYIFPVVAMDHGDPPQSSTATVIVNILDQNDHPPHFDQPIFFLEIEENMPPGSTCGRILAVDEDTGNNAKMIYSIIRDDDSSRYFSVDRDTGDVTTNQMFDREERDSYSFFMEVQNPSTPYYKDSAQVMVSVLDANDHDPVITNPSSSNNTLTIPNNTTVGSLILKITAQDKDDPENTHFEYMLPDSKRGSLFQVITVTGELILAREIRAGDAKTHRLLLVVSDGGSSPRSATATLFIRIPSEGLSAPEPASILSEPNFIIIVVIVLVTVLVAVLVITIICCIFRRDRKRRAGRRQQRQVKDKMYQAAKWVSTHSLPPGESPNNSSSSTQDLGGGHSSSEGSAGCGGGSGSEKKGKKEVSFSLEEDLPEKGVMVMGGGGGEGDPDTSGSLGSVFASPLAVGVSENNNLKPPVDGRFITFVSGKTSPASPHSTSPSCYESSDGHMYSNTPPIAETEDPMNMQLERPGGEDALSASSGETGTDSGRGGSEDEAHCHRGSALESTDPRTFHHALSHHSHHPHPYHNNPPHTASFNGLGDRGRRKPPSLSSLPEEHHPHLHPHPPGPSDHVLHSSPRPLQQTQHNHQQRPAGSSSAEHLPSQGKSSYPLSGSSRSLSFNTRDRDSSSSSSTSTSSPSSSSTDNYFSMDRSSGSDGPFRLKTLSSQQPPRRTFQTFGPQYHHNNLQQQQGGHPAWRRAKGLDGGWKKPVTPTTSFTTTTTSATTDEDDRTTTSGSYTLGPDEVPSDVEELHFQQMQDIMV